MNRVLDDRYRLGPALGRGGMATVYDATDTKLCRRVAVKLFHPGPEENTLARLSNEARLLGGLSHPGLVKVFDVSIADDQPYLVMQLIEGRTLRALINDGPLRPVVVARIGAQLAEALSYVHSRQIVHRDIKPSNVLLDHAGAGYLADFGIAALIGAARLTRTGHCVGTAAYLAPEQVSGASPHPAADIYALALVLLECLTGRPEFPGSDVEAAVARLARAPEVPDWLPHALRQTLIVMLARNPADRPDAARCVELFENYLAKPNRAVEAPTKELPVYRRYPAQIAAAGTVLAAIAATVLLTTTAETGQPTSPAQPPPVPVIAVVPATAAGQVVVDAPEEIHQPNQQVAPKEKGHEGKGKGGGKR
jgi:eukaryotic-like serine/threonine-protein kinase